MQVRLPAAVKAQLVRQVLVKREVLYSDASNLADGALLSRSLSSHLCAGGGFYKEREGKQNKDQGEVLKVSK